MRRELRSYLETVLSAAALASSSAGLVSLDGQTMLEAAGGASIHGDGGGTRISPGKWLQSLGGILNGSNFSRNGSKVSPGRGRGGVRQLERRVARLGRALTEVIPGLNPEARSPKSETRNPKPEARTRNLKPETRDPRPETRNQKSENQNQKPETRNPQE